MHKVFSIVFLFTCHIGLSQSKLDITTYDKGNPLIEVIKYDKLMGSTFVITAIDSSYARGNEICKRAIIYGNDIESKISSWDENSQTFKINKYAGIMPVKVDKELFDLIYRSKKISELTDGAFDISYASMDKVWDFTKDTITLPSKEKIKDAIAKINYKHIILNTQDTSVFLKTPGMKIGFGAIGKGYLADEIKKFLISNGIQSGIVNAGGDLITWGNPIGDTAWDLGIANPTFKNSILAKLKIKDKALVTSGDYEKFIVIDDNKYCHIINPKTGYPVNFLNSVSVLSNSAELADALATAIFVMGEKEGIGLVNDLNGVEAFAIKEKEIFASKNIEIENTQTITGEYKYYADNSAFKPCGSTHWTPITFPEPILAERQYISLLDGNYNNTVLLTSKGSFIEVKRESKTIKVFKVSEIVKMELRNCD